MNHKEKVIHKKKGTDLKSVPGSFITICTGTDFKSVPYGYSRSETSVYPVAN